jgi:oligopeptidase B
MRQAGFMSEPHAPIAAKRPTELTHHGDTRVDDWYWLREKENPEVIALLEAENAFTAESMRDTEQLQTELFEEFTSRIQETDLSVPVRKGAWWYYHRTVEGQQYGIHCRKADIDGVPGDEEIVLLDENVMAEGHEYFSLGTFTVDPAGRQLAYSTDTDGSEVFQLRIRDLQTLTDRADVINDTHYSSAWSRDGSVLFYTRQDATKRPYQVWRHVVGGGSPDELVLQEDDERFFVGVGSSKTDEYLMISINSSLTSELHLLRSGDPLGSFAVVEPRIQGVEYHLSHHQGENDVFYVVTNEDAPNFKLMVTPAQTPGRANWTEVIAHRTDVKLDGADTFADYLVLSERAEGTARIAIVELASLAYSVMEQPETVYTANSGGNPEFGAHVIRYSYTSMVTPRTLYDYDLVTGERTLLKQQPVLGGYDPSAYTTERTWAEAPDGTRVPISMVYRSDRPREAGPAVLYGYGSYEISIDPYFSSLRLSLLDRGFLFAIAHVRGGGDLGRLWYEDGKFLHKRNTFTDFVATAEHLVAQGYTSPETLIAQGGSAGGLLMGAVVNLRPELFAGIIAEVPFVDALTTMLDPSLPLTVHEYEEWGNPQDQPYYEYMKSYAPYDNVVEAAYPAMLVTAGLNDPRVGYWEPAKWVQKLREHNTGERPILLKTKMGAGHGGPSGRYDSWKEQALVYAFILQRVLKN